ncbi:MAG: hypothetical protein RXR10_07080 [Vulcanisaeta sp.]
MGFRFSVRNGLYVGGAVVLLMAMSLLTAIHMYTAINPPTIVLAIQLGGNKPQVTLWYWCSWTWGLPGMPLSSAPAGSNVPFSGSCTYAWTGIFSNTVYKFAVYIYDPFGPPANPAPYGTLDLPWCTGYQEVTLIYSQAYGMWYGRWQCSFISPVISSTETASLSGNWAPNMPYTYTGCASGFKYMGRKPRLA